jgi:hypothetical protein
MCVIELKIIVSQNECACVYTKFVFVRVCDLCITILKRDFCT